MFQFLCLLIFSGVASAGVITIPLDNSDFKQSPANDLIYQEKRISSTEVMELESSGYDTSVLNPYSSELYDETYKDLITNTIDSDKKLYFNSSLKSPSEYYRASVTDGSTNYTLAASLYNHQTLLRAALLRLIGYKVEIPIYKKSQRLYFSNLDEKNIFIESLSQSTLLAKSRWIPNKDEMTSDDLFVTLRGIVLEPAAIKAVPVYWPIMDTPRQKQRRVFRALIYIYTLTDFPQLINNISWETGKIFNNMIILDHAYATAFTNTTFQDLKWIHRKLNNLEESQITKAMEFSQYPKNIQILLLEKLKSRINNFSKLLNTRSKFSVNQKISALSIKKGKLLSSTYENYVPQFWEKDPLSPFRFSEIYKLFRSQITNDSASELLSKAIDNYIPMIKSGDAYQKIGQRIKENKNKTGIIPLKMWTQPTIQGEVSANRSIVFGQYLANNAPIQLVDNIAYKMRVGLFSYLSGLDQAITPTLSTTAGISRSWSHVRAMPDLSSATQQELKKLFIPNLLKNLGKVLKDSYECSVTNDAWVVEEIIVTTRTWVIYYDKSIDSGKVQAITLREKLINEGIPEEQILLSPTNKDLICEKEIIEKRNSSIEEFVKGFAAEETLTITDSLDLNGSLGAKFDISGVDKLSANLSIGKNKAILRSFSIRKVAQGIEITIQTQNNLKTTFSQGMKFYIDLVTNKTQWEKGAMLSKVYKIKLDGVTEIEKINAIQTLREIFIRNSHSNLLENYNPIELDHKAKTKLNTFRFFWKKSENLRLNNKVEIIVPNASTNFEIPEEEITNDQWTIPQPERIDLPIDQRSKTLYTSMTLKRKGSNYHNFLDRVLNEWKEWFRIGSTDSDPGNSVKGYSQKWYYTTEVDLSNPTAQPMTKVEFSNTGWSANKKTLNWMINLHESYFKTDTENIKIDRRQFNQTSLLRSYNIKSTLLLYPLAIEFLKEQIITSTDQNFVKFLRALYNKKKWKRACSKYGVTSSNNSRAYIFQGENKKRYCIPRKLRNLVKKRKYRNPKTKIGQNNQVHNLIESLFIIFTPQTLIKTLPKDSYFGSIYIGGYRDNDSIGYLQYTSDTIGTYDTELRTGYFDQFSQNLGLTPYLIKGMTYTPGM